MLVSVIIPTYNRKNLLKDALESVLQQSYSNIEIIVVDDGSEQDIKSLVDSVDDERVVCIQHDVNKGASVARNTGIEHANGDCVAFLDSDDQWRRDKIEKQVSKLEESGDDVGIVYCDFFDGYESSSKLLVKPHDLREGDIHRDLLSGWINIMTSQILVKSECFTNVGKFDPEFPSYQEYDLLTRIAKKYSVVYVDERLVVKNSGEYAQIGDDYKSRFRGLEMYLHNHRSDMIEYFGEDSITEFSNRRLAKTYRSKVCESLEKRKFVEAAQDLYRWNDEKTESKTSDILLLLTSLILGESGRNKLKKTGFLLRCHRYGYISSKEIQSANI